MTTTRREKEGWTKMWGRKEGRTWMGREKERRWMTGGEDGQDVKKEWKTTTREEKTRVGELRG